MPSSVQNSNRSVKTVVINLYLGELPSKSEMVEKRLGSALQALQSENAQKTLNSAAFIVRQSGDSIEIWRGTFGGNALDINVYTADRSAQESLIGPRQETCNLSRPTTDYQKIEISEGGFVEITSQCPELPNLQPFTQAFYLDPWNCRKIFCGARISSVGPINEKLFVNALEQGAASHNSAVPVRLLSPHDNMRFKLLASIGLAVATALFMCSIALLVVSLPPLLAVGPLLLIATATALKINTVVIGALVAGTLSGLASQVLFGSIGVSFFKSNAAGQGRSQTEACSPW